MINNKWKVDFQRKGGLQGRKKKQIKKGKMSQTNNGKEKEKTTKLIHEY